MTQVQTRICGRLTYLNGFIEYHAVTLGGYTCIPCPPSDCAVNPHAVWWTREFVEARNLDVVADVT